MPNAQIIRHRGDYDDNFYWNRVHRNLGWLGENDAEQRARQEKLRDCVIGIAGTGGIGGATALRLVRMGARHLKLADSDEFDVTNIQRQVGADVKHLGRNKAEVVGEMAFELTEDVEIDVFPEGIQPHTAAEFVDGCDIVLDQIDVYAVGSHYALHEAFRAQQRCQTIITVLTIGHGSYVYKYTLDSMPIEEVYGLPKDAELGDDNLRQLIGRIVPVQPDYPGPKTFHDWWVDNRTVAIWGGCPPLCEGVLVERMAMEIMDFPGVTPIPVQPGYMIFDSRTWTTRVYSGEWWNDPNHTSHLLPAPTA
jgi:molybdopterin/thiamine biosynthesis adenylyltransferase